MSMPFREVTRGSDPMKAEHGNNTLECLYHKCCRANGLRDSCSTIIIREAACLESIGECQYFGLVGHQHACLSACPRTFCKAYSDHMQTTFHDQCCEQLDRQAETKNDMAKCDD